MSGSHVIRGSVSLPEAELMWRFSRSSGPGGQHVNTSDSKVELSFDLAKTEALPAVWKQRALERLAGRLVDGVVTVRSSEHRSQWRNREAAAVRLTALLAEATAPHHAGDGRLVLEGPALNLEPKTAVALALAMHELATNAVKYGALSTAVSESIGPMTRTLPSSAKTSRRLAQSVFRTHL